jgi:hypothetical protein
VTRLRVLWLIVAILSVFGLAYLLNSQSARNASAWILWEKNMTTKDAVTMTTWEPIDGFERLSDCHESGREIIQAAQQFMNSGDRKVLAVRPDGRSVVYEVAEGAGKQSVDYRLLCFPGSFDPRVGL